jgi:hypothetical protein
VLRPAKGACHSHGFVQHRESFGNAAVFHEEFAVFTIERRLPALHAAPSHFEEGITQRFLDAIPPSHFPAKHSQVALRIYGFEFRTLRARLGDHAFEIGYVCACFAIGKSHLRHKPAHFPHTISAGLRFAQDPARNVEILRARSVELGTKIRQVKPLRIPQLFLAGHARFLERAEVGNRALLESKELQHAGPR